jgi:hypothetical protein
MNARFTSQSDIRGYGSNVCFVTRCAIGFSAIVMLLRQSLGRKLRPFDALFAHVYMEFGLIVSVGAMLPPLFALWNL